MKSLEEREARERHLEAAIKNAVEAADRIIMAASDGSCEETDYLTAEIALAFVQKVVHRHSAILLARDVTP